MKDCLGTHLLSRTVPRPEGGGDGESGVGNGGRGRLKVWGIRSQDNV
jgi:hypothetical protein